MAFWIRGIIVMCNDTGIFKVAGKEGFMVGFSSNPIP
jgi:hypothetical protein